MGFLQSLVIRSEFVINSYFLCLDFRDRVSLHSPGCPGTHSIDQAGLELRNPPASASQVLGLKGEILLKDLYWDERDCLVAMVGLSSVLSTAPT